jgi:hypothetical protein
MNDYLYPIKKQQLDLKTYLMVKAAMTMLSSNNFKRYQVEFPEEERLHIKETAKNAIQHTTSDAMGKVIDPDSIPGQYIKHGIDDGRGELINLVFE